MAWVKKAVVNYHFINAADEDYFVDFYNAMNALLASGEVYGSFQSGESNYLWKINSIEHITETETFFISLVKEKDSWPVWFNGDGDISSVPLMEGSLGELYYAYINPASKFMLSLSATTGVATGSFKKFLNEFSSDGGIKLTPLFEDNIDSKVLSWDYYKKISSSINFPTHDDLVEFIMTKEGSLFGIIDELGGLKLDITITAPKQKQVLNTAQAKEFISSFASNDFCGKLVVKGAEFETELLEEFDIKNAQVKFSQEIEILGSYMSCDEAKSILNSAFIDRAKDLLIL